MVRQSAVQDDGAIDETGVVQKIGSVMRKTRYGDKPVFSFLLNDNWYQTGFKDSGVKPGDVIEFSFEEDKYGRQVDVDDVDITGSEPVPVAAPVSTGGRQQAPATGSGRGNDYWDGQSRLITYQASRNAAIAIVSALLDADKIVLPKVEKKQAGAVLDLVDEITTRYFTESSDNARLESILDEENEDSTVDPVDTDSDD